MAFDSATGQLILFSGENASNDTWNWDGTNWNPLSPSTSPQSRGSASMAFDPASGQLILFGGLSNSTSDTLNDTWNWGFPCPKAITWTELFPADFPSARNGSSMAFDPVMGQLILFGGIDM